MKNFSLIMIAFNLVNSLAFAETPQAKRLVKTEGKGQFVKSSEGRLFCTHDNTVLAFAESETNLGLDVINKNSGENANYFISDYSYTLNIKGTMFEKSKGSASFPKFIQINSSIYYFNSLDEIDSAEADMGFMFKRIIDSNKFTSTLYCSKK